MARKRLNHHFTHVIALMIVSSVLFCACQSISTDQTGKTESSETEITLYPDSSDWSFEAEGAESTTTSATQSSEETEEAAVVSEPSTSKLQSEESGNSVISVSELSVLPDESVPID